MINTSRYAVYFAPEPDSSLGQEGARVLGRSAWTGTSLAQPELPGVLPARLHELTADPRHYGLHATLKPPFFLAEDYSVANLEADLGRLAASIPSFWLPELKVRSIGRFIALALTQECPELTELAKRCVVELDAFRQPPSVDELMKRRAKGLSAAQEQLLIRYGYPYVLEEFRFHLTLTGRIDQLVERDMVQSGLQHLFQPIVSQPVRVDSVCLFCQPCLEEPFTVMSQIPLGVSL